MTNLYFVRHAHSTYTPNERHRPLSERGKKEAAKVTDSLIERNIEVVISSPYCRAIQTVEGIAQLIHKEIVLCENLKERTLSTQPVKDFEQAVRMVWENLDFKLSGGESNHEAQSRGVATIEQLLISYQGKHIAIGTHGNLLALILNYYDSCYDYHFWKSLDMPDVFQLTFKGFSLQDIKRVWQRE